MKKVVIVLFGLLLAAAAFGQTNTPTDTPTVTATNTPTNTPTDTPTNSPTNTPTVTPTFTPTNTPTVGTLGVLVGYGGANVYRDLASKTAITVIYNRDTVRWTWRSGTHSVTSGSCVGTTCTPDGRFLSSPIRGQGYVWTVTFGLPGTYNYYCLVHGFLEHGVVIVGGPTPTVTPTP